MLKVLLFLLRVPLGPNFQAVVYRLLAAYTFVLARRALKRSGRKDMRIVSVSVEPSDLPASEAPRTVVGVWKRDKE